MIADVVSVSGNVVQAFVDGDADGLEEAWYQALERSCAASSCDAAGGTLVEFCAMTAEKASRLGATLPIGFWIGVQPHDKTVLDRIRSGEITEFSIAIDSDGIRIEFKPDTPEKEDSLEKNCNCSLPDTVTKALRGTLKRDEIDSAITDLARSMRQDGESASAAYGRALESDIGKRLYGAYESAERSVATPINKHEPKSQAFDKIAKAAKLTDAMTPGEQARAIADAIAADPTLYAAYDSERVA